MAQEQVQRHGGGDGEDEAQSAAPAGQERREKLGEYVDAILDEIEGDVGLRAVVLTGAGDAFCAGADIGSRSTLSGPAGVAELRTRADAVRILAGLPQITVAAVNGACAGMGTALAAACDLRLMARRSRVAWLRTMG